MISAPKGKQNIGTSISMVLHGKGQDLFLVTFFWHSGFKPTNWRFQVGDVPIINRLWGPSLNSTKLFYWILTTNVWREFCQLLTRGESPKSILGQTLKLTWIWICQTQIRLDVDSNSDFGSGFWFLRWRCGFVGIRSGFRFQGLDRSI